MARDDLPDHDSLNAMFDALIDDITDVMAEGNRHEEVRKLLFRWGIQLQLLSALYEQTDDATLDRLRASLGGEG